MSGPIVRKYGFPNFDQIFGKKELEHGVDDDAVEPAAEAPAETPAPKKKSAPKTKAPKKADS
jgi:hypothetical protein